MSIPVLATKLHIPPPRKKMIFRHRLIERLNEGLSASHELTLISTSAGFGKTTLVSEWAAVCERPVAWLSLDEGDNDPIRFLTYLVAALQTIQANIGEEVLSVLQSSQPQLTESVLITLLNEINAITNPFILVLDDYHAIDSEPVDELLAFLLKHIPPQMHMVITTREDPHLPIALLRARGQLTELRVADLRFTSAEANVFLNQVMDLNLSMEEVAVLETRTEGWIVGLQLAAISMQGHQDSSSFIKSFTGSHHFVLDYLMEEVLHQQPEDVQTFLLRTSILDRMCGTLINAVLGSPYSSGQETLEYLDHNNLFIAPLDNERCWYRYHHLFAELLRQRLGNPMEFAELNLRASRWYEESGDLGAAFHHAISAGDFVRAADLAEAAWQDMNSSFQSVAWLGWVKKLPEKVIRVRPVLCTLLGRAFADAGEPEASEFHLQDAERCLDGSQAVTGSQHLRPLPAMIALVRASNAQMQGDYATTVKYAELALRIIPKDDFVLRAQAIITLEITHWASGNLESAIRALDGWMESMTLLGNHVFVVASAFAVAELLLGLGRLSDAEWTYRNALQLAAQHGPEALRITAHHHLGLSMIYRQRGDDTLAAQHLNLAGELGLQTTLVDWPHRWNVAQAQLQEAAGNLEAALALLDEAKRVYIRSALPDLRPVSALKARIYLKQGRSDKVRAWADECGLALEDEVSYLHEFDHLTLARLEIANPLVNTLLARLLHAAEVQNRKGSTLDILLVQVLVHEAQGNRPQALAALQRALSLTATEGYIRIFVDEGESMRMLMNELFRNRDDPMGNYVDMLMSAINEPTFGPGMAITRQKPDMSELLSGREMEVLKLLRSELSGPDIASHLFVSLNTFRTHTKNIYVKLGVNNRQAAVRRINELDLF